MRTTITPILGLPQLADRAVRITLRKPYGTVLVCGLLMALMNGGLTALIALLSGGLESTAGSLVLLGSMIVWLPLMIALSAVVYTLLAVHAAHRVLLGVQLSFWQSVGYFFRPRVLITVVLMLCAIAMATVFFVIPGLFAAIFLSLTVPVMVAERRYLMDAMLRSADLVWANPEGRVLASPVVRIAALGALVFALSTLMTIIFQLPVQILTQGLMFREALAGTDSAMSMMTTINWISLPFAIATAVVGIGVYSYAFHLLGLYYRDLVERREAPALAAAIAGLASTDAAAGSAPMEQS